MHVILEEAPACKEEVVNLPSAYVFCLSAKNRTSLDLQLGNMIPFLRRNPTVSPQDLAFTLQVGREEFPFRFARVFSSIEQLLHILAERKERYFTKEESGQAHAPVDPQAYKAVTKQLCQLVSTNSSNNLKNSNSSDVIEIDVHGGVTLATEFLDISQISVGPAQIGLKGILPHIFAKLWSFGYSVEWEAYLPKGVGKRISLPTYPFARIRHWLPRGTPQANTTL